MGAYKVRAGREGRWWWVEIPEINQVTQGRNAREVELMAKEVISLVTSCPLDDVAVEIDWILPGSVAEHLHRAQELRMHSLEANAAAARESRAAARELRDAGLGLKDIGALLGVSYQRAHQLVSSTP